MSLMTVGPVHGGDTAQAAHDTARAWLATHRRDVPAGIYRIETYSQPGSGGHAARVTVND